MEFRRWGNVAALVGEPTFKQAGNGKGGGIFCAEGAGGGSKIEASADGGSEATKSVEGGSGWSGSGDGRIPTSGNVDMAQPLSPRKRVYPNKTKRKNKHNSPTKVGASANQDVHPSDQVSTDLKRIGTHSPTKLSIFNVHGTFLDCSLLSEPNPNTSICMITDALTRRFVFTPWLIKFIDRCFKNFRVAFWHIKNKSNIEDVVVEMMRKFEGLDSHKPMYC